MARTVIEELVVLFGFQTDKAGAREALRTYTDLHHAVRDLVSVAQRAATALLAPLQGVVKLGEAAFLAGKRFNMTAEEVQSLDTAAKLTGVSVNTLHTVIDKLGASAAKAFRSKEHAIAFAGLGMSARTASGHLKTNNQLLFEVMERLAAMPNAGKRAQYAFALMGEASGRLMPLLAQGPGYLLAIKEAAQDAGSILTNETAEAARDLSFWWQLLTLRMDGVERRFGAGLIPSAQKVVGTMTAIAKANKTVIDQRVDVVVKHVSAAIEGFAKVLRAVGSGIEKIVGFFGGFERVLLIAEAIVGATFLAAFGAATAAIIKFGLALLFANAFPVLMALTLGALLGVIALVVQDLQSTNSLFEKLWDNPWNNKDDPPILKHLKEIVQVLKSMPFLWERFRKATDFVGDRQAGADDPEIARQQRVARENAARRLAARTSTTTSRAGRHVLRPGEMIMIDEFGNAVGTSTVPPAGASTGTYVPYPDDYVRDRIGASTRTSTGSVGRGGGDVRIEVNQTFNGPADPDAVRTATQAAVQSAVDDTRLQDLLDASSSGAR